MNVLSLFDGMSCGRIALERLGIPVDKYYASEIDKYAIQVSEANYPDIIRLGDVCDVKAEDLEPIDLIIAGSPCQGFSFAGKQLAFDDPRSALFFEFVRLLKECKPKYFLLENVRMKKEFLDVITEQVSSCYESQDVAPQFVDLVGNVRFEPIFINSALVSAQNRQRFYWTNIPGIEQPEQRGIVLRDILETTPADPTLMSDSFVARNGDRNCMIDESKEKAHNLSAMEYVKNGRQGNYLACDEDGAPKHKPVKQTERNRRHLRQLDDKSLCMTATMYKGAGNNGMTLVPQKLVDDTSDLPEKSSVIKSSYYKSSRANFENDKSKGGKFSATGIPQTRQDKPIKVGINVEEVRVRKHEVDIETHDKPQRVGTIKDGSQGDRVYSKDGKAITLNAQSGGTAGNGNMLVETHDTPKQVDTAVDINGHDQIKRVYSPDGKAPTVTTCGGGHREPKVITGGAMRGRAYDEDGKRMDKDGKSVASQTKQMLELRKDAKSNAITTVGKDSLVVENEVYWRKLTPVECERLQTVPDNYTNHVSNTQRYKMLGNGWTVEVICHILKNMEK